MKHLTMQQLDDLGFELVKSYEHDQFMTQRRVKGCLTVETTWLFTGEFESQDVTVDEVSMLSFAPDDLKVLDLILNKEL